MSSTLLSDTTKQLDAAGVEVAWRQWHGIGAAASTAHPARSIVDPEALILYTLAATEREHRFEPLLSSWLEVNASLLSVQRMRNLQKLFPAQLRERVQRFSQIARVIGKHPKWAALGDNEEAIDEESVHLPEVRRATRTPLRRPSALLLRLRRAFGVGAKADVLTTLLGHAARPLTVKAVVDLTGYTNVAVRGALGDLASSGFVETLKGRPQQFTISVKDWQTLLHLRELPGWQPWAQFYAFLAAYDELANRARTKRFSEYAYYTKVRELMDGHPVLFARLLVQRSERSEADDAVHACVSELTHWALASA